MRSPSQKTFSAAVRRVLADRLNAPSQAPRARLETSAGPRRGPSAMATRRELKSFRRAQGVAYWHRDRHAGRRSRAWLI